jgi:hypothetical protein
MRSLLNFELSIDFPHLRQTNQLPAFLPAVEKLTTNWGVNVILSNILTKRINIAAFLIRFILMFANLTVFQHSNQDNWPPPVVLTGAGFHSARARLKYGCPSLRSSFFAPGD